MPGRKKGEDRGEITAYPRGMPAGRGSIPEAESGLSVDTEDLGAQFLSNATEQCRSERPPAGAAGDDFGAEVWSEDGGLGESFDLDPQGWERAITRSLRIGKLTSSYPPPMTGVRKKPSEPVERPAHAWDEIDLTDEAIQEASLLDHEGAELGEVESPELRTDDTHTHGRRRGGHMPSGKRKR